MECPFWAVGLHCVQFDFCRWCCNWCCLVVLIACFVVCQLHTPLLYCFLVRLLCVILSVLITPYFVDFFTVKYRLKSSKIKGYDTNPVRFPSSPTSCLYGFPVYLAQKTLWPRDAAMAGLTSRPMPVMPWHGAPRFRGPQLAARIVFIFKSQ